MDALFAKAEAGFHRHGAVAVAAVLAIAVAGGGSSRGHGAGVVLAQLVALPVLGWTVLAACGPNAGRRRPPLAPLLVAGAIVVLVAALQLPIPPTLWELPPARSALARDLQAGGVALAPHWTLSPLATERALWFLLPGLAVFAGALHVDPAHLRGLLLLVVALGIASLVLGALQMAAPRDSVVNPFPEWAPAFNGLFENPNHQASLLALSATIVAALPWRSREAGHRLRRSAPAWLLLGAAVALAIPLTGSRAGMGLAVLGVVVALGFRFRHRRLAARDTGARDTRQAPRSRRVVLATIAIAAALAVAAIAFSRLGLDGTVRWALVEATAGMAREHAPLGAGFGSFPAWFDQSAPSGLVQWEYFNHAHDEYVQWWFELGVAGVACVLAVLAVLAAYRPRPGTHARTGLGVPLAAWLGCMLLMLHSLVDYVLRTPALMTTGALMAGVLVASHAHAPRLPAPGTKEQQR